MNKSINEKKFMLNEVEEENENNIDSIKVIDNHIYFYSEITIKSILDLTESIKNISNKLLVFNIQYNTNIEIYLHINSDGGDVFGVLSIINLIENNTININTIIEGNAASSATILAMTGKHRQITQHSYMLIHNISSGFWGKMHEIEDEVKNLNLLTSDIKKLYRKYTNITAKQLDQLLKKDLLLDANTCLKYGFIDEII
jgi:ATP-dependent protease ClpP protease subunit|tara:strand:+ start:704 stop:1303 length:600 start_codon:yes stop_codon:yes gene_type:complete